MELDTRIANCLTEQYNYKEELQDIDDWPDSREKDSEGERFIALAEERDNDTMNLSSCYNPRIYCSPHS